MKDGIIKGNGTSRFIKSVPNFLSLYPTYEDFVAALIAGTLPIDLNGLNPAGWTQQGTELNKGHLLSDAAVSALGLTGTDPTPDDAFKALPTDAMLRKIINKQSARSPASGDYLGGNNGKISISNLLSYVKGQSIATGSYIGTGTYGPSNPCSLTFPFVPTFAFIYEVFDQAIGRFVDDYLANSVKPFMITQVLTTSFVPGVGFCRYRANCWGKRSGDLRTYYWYAYDNGYAQLNDDGYTYFWVAVV